MNLTAAAKITYLIINIEWGNNMDLKINLEFDLNDFFERWGDDSLEQCIREEMKAEVLKKVKASDQYKALVKKRMSIVMQSLDNL